MITAYPDFEDAILNQIKQLKNYGAEVDPGRWQGVPTEGKPDLVTVELMDVAFRVHMPGIGMGAEYPQGAVLELQEQIKPNLPWADDHFAERVGRVPTNPGEQYKNWPWWKGQEEQTKIESEVDGPGEGFKFTHTYQERFWPTEAGRSGSSTPVGGKVGSGGFGHRRHLYGIRYSYGDLDDVVNMLLKDPHTRQAYLPIFFPEDTGAVHGGRIPCSLGYHFLLRNDQLHLWYDIRSCDAVRHFRDDLYLAARLALWVIEECHTQAPQVIEDYKAAEAAHDLWMRVRPGIMTFHCHSFHVHKGDMHLL